MKMFRHLSSVFAIATIAPLALAATLAATPAIAQADQLPNPDWVALLSDYEKNYWQAPTDAEHGGKVLDADTMKLDEDLAVAINHKAAENLDKDGLNAQRKRALVDSDLQAEEAMPDALGPVLGKYMSEGLKSGKLNAVADIFSFNVASTYASKRAAMHPRPYLNRAESSYGGTNDLAGLPATLDIKQSPSWLEHVPGYSNLQKNSSYPSGHTTGAYSWGIALAGMIPELAPQIMARTSEAGNNRIVLGVHYPLDIMGGHIAGQYGVATAVSGEKTAQEGAAARAELVDYLTAQCKADNHGDTLDACITNTGANAANGYRNDFTDEVSTKPVTDRASALAAYKARMTYGFQATGTTGQAPVVPDSAVRMLDNVAAFKSLDSAQKKAVLAATEGDSGYPLDASSQGWARVNLAAAYSAKVTLSADGKNVVKVEPGQAQASVVRETSGSNGNNGGNGNGGSNAGNTGVNNASGRNPSGTQPLSKTGADVSGIASAFILIAAAGVTITMIRRKHAI